MRISDAVASLEREVERLKRREAELMDRCGVLLERSRTVPGTVSGIIQSPPGLLELIVAADNVAAQWRMGGATSELLGELEEGRQKVPNSWMNAIRTAYAESLHRDRKEKAGPA